jgi:hypothetical protein
MRIFPKLMGSSLFDSFVAAGLVFVGYHMVVLHSDAQPPAASSHHAAPVNPRREIAWPACGESADGCRVWRAPSMDSLALAAR